MFQKKPLQATAHFVQVFKLIRKTQTAPVFRLLGGIPSESEEN